MLFPPPVSGYFARYLDKVDWEAGEDGKLAGLIAESQCKQLTETALIMTECRREVAFDQEERQGEVREQRERD